MNQRKVIQITTACFVGEADQQQPYLSTIALCDDGTMWERDNYGNPWRQIDNVPQPEGAQP